MTEDYFDKHMTEWKSHGFDERWAMSKEMWQVIETDIKDKTRFGMYHSLEFGSGLSTQLISQFDSLVYHKAVESDRKFRDKYEALGVYGNSVCRSEVWTGDVALACENIICRGHRFNLILVDGPCGDRSVVVPFIHRLIGWHHEWAVIVDDVNRKKDMDVAMSILNTLNIETTVGFRVCDSSHGRQFAVISR